MDKERKCKICKDCNINKNIDEFYYVGKDSKDGYRNKCKDCTKKIGEKKRQEIKNSDKKIINKKVCFHCKVEKNISEFNKRNDWKDGYISICKQCNTVYRKQWTEKKKIEKKKIIKNKICSNCKVEKNIKDFTKNNINNDGYHSWCKNCLNNSLKNWRYKNKEKQSKQWKKNREENYIKFKAMEVRRNMITRARKKNLDVDKEYYSIQYFYNLFLTKPYCQCCGIELKLIKDENRYFRHNSPSIDKVDNTKGYIKGNVAIICWTCNRKKSDSTSDELRMIADFIDNWEK